MPTWTFPLASLETGAGPTYQRIARSVILDIQRGRLKPGDPLPGSRTLARTAGVHRNTVLAALSELQAEGWIQSRGHRIQVAEDLPGPSTGDPGPRPGNVGFPLEVPPLPSRSPSPAPHLLDLGGGLPDLRLVPVGELARAYRRALRAPEVLGYGDPQGDLRLRGALAGVLSEVRGLSAGPGELMTTGGSQMALDLVARTLVRPGDRVAVEDPGYPPAWATLRAAGARLEAVQVDENGLSIEGLEALLGAGPLRALYCTPHHQYPTTSTLKASRRMRLLELARVHRFAILEDDYDFEFHFEGSPVLPLASADGAGVVVYMGSLSKVLAPGLRLGFLAGPRPLVEALALRRLHGDRQGDQALERAVAELLEDGLMQRHVRKMARIYQARRATLTAALREHLAGEVAFEVPPGGMSLWLRACPSLDVDAWAQRSEAAGARFQAGRRFDFRGRSLPFLRLGFTSLNDAELREGVRRMKAALPP